MKYLGIDPGLRKTLGYAVVEVPLQGTNGIDVLDCGLVDLRRLPLRVAASILRDKAKKYGVTEAVIEDFFFFGKKSQKERAPWVVVARMQNLIGYLCGFLSGNGIPVDVVSPRRWKMHVEERQLQEILTRKGLNGVSLHVVSAVGVVLGEIEARRKEAGL